MRQLVLVPLVTLTVLLSACGGDDGDSSSVIDDTSASAATDTEASETQSDSTEPAGSDTDDGAVDDAPAEDTDADTDEAAAEAPAEDSGTVTVDGTTVAVSTADFLICETVNPAFAADVNIIVAPEGLSEVEVSGVLPDDVDGAYGDFPDQIRVTAIDIERDGRTVSGSFTADGTAVEFSFTC